MQINHIDGNKRNNNVENLELVSGTENVNHAHDLGLYKYDLKLSVIDLKLDKIMKFRSLRSLCRYLNVSLNYLKPRIISSKFYPLMKRYVITMDEIGYKNYIMELKCPKKFYVCNHETKAIFTLTSFSQISILLGLSYIDISRRLNKSPHKPYYIGGFTFSFDKKLIDVESVSEITAGQDKYKEWKKLNAILPKKV